MKIRKIIKIILAPFITLLLLPMLFFWFVFDLMNGANQAEELLYQIWDFSVY